ncbi:MAG TPA: hypothetical protein PK402_07365, partial [Tepidisphaeraceae bacterium]|nr:hypothetical protein [Tepidisphaeraceae bacterium]
MRLTRGQKVLLTIVPVLMLCVIAAVGIERRRTHALEAKCAKTLRAFGQAIWLYMHENRGRLPADFPAFAGDQPGELFICPATDEPPSTATTPDDLRVDLAMGRYCSYIYVGDGFTPSSPKLDSKLDADVVLIFEPLKNHNGKNMNVLFADQHCEVVSGERAQTILKQHAAGTRPIRLTPDPQ